MLEAFIARWGYLAVGAGTFVEGEAVLIAAGALAHRGLLSLPLVMVAAFVGSVAGDQATFHVGRYVGRSVIERRARWKARAGEVETWLGRRGSWFVVGFRFIYGIRTVTALFLGASGYSPGRFLLLDAIGAAAWSIVVGGLGWALGAGLSAGLRRTLHVEEALVAAVVVAAMLWLGRHAIHRWWRQLRAGRRS